MNKIKHHLTEALLMGYSAGTLPEAFNLVIATHISMCDDCRAALAEYEALGGEVMMSGDAVDMSADSLAATLALLEQDQSEAPAPVANEDVPAPLAGYLKGGLDTVKWKRIGGGVSQMVLPTSQSATVRLLKIPGGAAVPDHGHNGTELTLVLKGAFADEMDHFSAGDIEVANEDVIHTPIAEPGQDCICLAATDAPLEFKSVLPRIAQKFIGI